MEICDVLKKRMLEKTIGEGKIYFFGKGVDLGGGSGTEEHPHICIKVDNSVLVISIMSSRVDSTRKRMLDRGIVKEKEVPLISASPQNKLTRSLSYVECNNTYECSISEFTDNLANGSIWDTGGALSGEDLLAVICGILSSDQVAEEIKDRLQ